MEGLNIIEASKMEVGTEFKVIKEGKEVRYILLEDPYGKHFSLGSNKGSWSIAYSSLIQAKFIPVPKEKEVSFMSAVEAFDDGKKIKSLYSDERGNLSEYIYDGKKKIDFTDEDNQPPQAREILEAKWYITY